MEIRRQGETHDPQRVHGPASTRNQVRAIVARIEALPSGKLRMSLPGARGWATVVGTRDELVRAIAQAFTEAQIASYGRWRGQGYDRDIETPVYRDDPDPLIAAVTPLRGGRTPQRSDVHPPDAWTPLENGSWRSPGGRVFRSDSDAVRRVREKRRIAGID
jgi:hypothetical protein